MRDTDLFQMALGLTPPWQVLSSGYNAEQKERHELARPLYIWLKNPGNLKLSLVRTLEELTVKNLNVKTSRAYHFQEFFSQPPHTAEAFLKKWFFWATHYFRGHGNGKLLQ